MAKKINTKNTRKKKKKTIRKPKIVLKRNQVIILTAAIFAVCVCMLCMVILTTPPTVEPEIPIVSEKQEISMQQINVENAKQENTSQVNKQEPTKQNNVSKENIEKTQSKSEVMKPEVAKEKKVESSKKTIAEKSTSVEKEQTNATIQKQEETKDKYNIPVAVNNATVVYVLDDGGQNLSHLQYFLDLPFPLTVAVLPKLIYSQESAKRVRESGKELILHQPMQAKNLDVNPGPGAITPEMHTYDIESIVEENIAQIGPIVGMNNHEGSLITESASKIGAVLDVCARENIFFLDSRTSAATKAPQAALERGMKIWERDVFLDNTQNPTDIINQILTGLKIANKNGFVIMIGHVWSSSNLAQIMEELYPIMKEKGYHFSTIRGLYENFGN